MLYLKSEVSKWFEERVGMELEDEMNSEPGVIIGDHSYISIQAIENNVLAFRSPVRWAGYTPESIIKEMQSELVGYIPSVKAVKPKNHVNETLTEKGS